jgi:multidrug efflux pump subunit AcrB
MNKIQTSPPSGLDRLVAAGLNGSLPLMIILLSLFMGIIALNYTAREEEPQIVVPMLDIQVNAPGMSARQVERQVTFPLEKLLAQIKGVEHVYSSSMTGQAVVTLRFYVGEDREDAILNTYNKLYSNQSDIPAGVTAWEVNPVEVDDVPILMLGLWTDLSAPVVSDYELKRVADEFANYLQAIPDTSEVKVVGGRQRTIRIQLKPESLAARQSTAMDVLHALQVSNLIQPAGYWTLSQHSVQLESGDVLRDVESLQQLVVNVVDGVPVLLQDIADVLDGPEEADSYTWIDFAAQHPMSASVDSANGGSYPMVVLSVAKKAGSNAVTVAENVHALIDELQSDLLPANIYIETLRDYGQTANEKVDNLTSSLLFAVFTVVVFIAVFLGWRPAVVVGIAVPISYGVTLALDMAFGYTINRVTLFALILSLGLLVDDPITGVDNIQRFLKKRCADPAREAAGRIVEAVAEIKVPLIMSTVTIILAFIPLAFITGMMGPYMAPMAFNVPVSVAVSTLVAFLVTPWLSKKILKTVPGNRAGTEQDDEDSLERDSGLYRFYHRLLMPLFENRRKSKRLLWAMLLLFIAAAMLPMMRWVPLKLLPFDNKNEVQVIIDMPESATLEQTASVAKRVSQTLLTFNEVLAVAGFVGEPSPMDFNGMVRHYYQRKAPYQADLRLTLLDKTEREHQSHAVVLRMREHLKHFAREVLQIEQLTLRVVEVPPGPPVLSTLVAEISGTRLTTYEDLQEAARIVEARLKREPFVDEVDTSIEDPQTRLRFEVDKTFAALSGISTHDINQIMLLATNGLMAGHLQQAQEAVPLPIMLELPLAERSALSDLEKLQVKGRAGVVKASGPDGLDAVPQPLVALGELGEFRELVADTSIQHKDLKPVVYVTAELSGRTPAEVIADLGADLRRVSATENTQTAQEVTPWQDRHFIGVFMGQAPGDSWYLPEDIDLNWGGEGEWLITIDVFRDMGLAFMFALVGIFFVLKFQTGSTSLSLIIMSAIPLTVIGIMPGFAILNLFGERTVAGAPDPVLFTATAMIGMIALAGIVVRNSLILVEFITQARARGADIKDALVMAGAVRMRPVLLTAGTTLLGNMVIILDPVFSGLALAIMFGIIASTVFTLVIVPVVYFLVFGKPEQTQVNDAATL